MGKNIILIDDHTLFRRGTRSVLNEAGYEVIDGAVDRLSRVELAEQLRPDLVLLGLGIPVTNGREALGQVLSSSPEQKVMVLTVSEDGNKFIECMKQGTCGFSLKNINADFPTEAIGRALNGDNIFSPEMTVHLMKPLVGPVQSQSNAHIRMPTLHKHETLHHLAIDHSNKVVAKKLNLAESAVKVYVQNILHKLGLSSRVQATVYAIRHDIRPPEKGEE